MRRVIAIAALIAAPAFAAPLEVLRIVDGDTLLVRNTPTALNPKTTALVRLRGVNAPESSKGQANNLCAGDADCIVCERNAGRAATAYLTAIVRGECNIGSIGSDKYGRVSGAVTCNGIDVGAALIASGHAAPYSGERRKPWAGCGLG